MRIVAMFCLMIVLSSCLQGCNAPADNKAWEIQKARGREALELAKDSGTIAVVQLDYKGRGGVYADNEWGINLGGAIHATFIAVPGMMELFDKVFAAYAAAAQGDAGQPGTVLPPAVREPRVP